MTEKLRRTVAYIAHMSNKVQIKIDEEEFLKVKTAIATGQNVIVKQGIINPSFLVALELDEKRIGEWKHNVHHYHDEQAQIDGIKPLQNITAVREVVFIDQPKTLKIT